MHYVQVSQKYGPLIKQYLKSFSRNRFNNWLEMGEFLESHDRQCWHCFEKLFYIWPAFALAELQGIL